jgi:hypothetical protein
MSNETTTKTADEKPTTLAVTEFDAEMREALSKAAQENERTMAGEARYRLRESLGLTRKTVAATA